MPKGLQITVPVGCNQGIFTNIFVRLNFTAIDPDNTTPNELAALAYKNEATFDTNPVDSVLISWLPPLLKYAGFTISDLNNRADVATYLYNRLKNKIENTTGAGTVIIVP